MNHKIRYPYYAITLLSTLIIYFKVWVYSIALLVDLLMLSYQELCLIQDTISSKVIRANYVLKKTFTYFLVNLCAIKLGKGLDEIYNNFSIAS